MKKITKAKKRVDARLDAVRLPIVLAQSFREIAVTTDSGTVLPGMTIAAISDELTAYLYQERTGVTIMTLQRMPWKKILEATNQTAATAKVPLVLSFLEGELTKWLKENAGKVGTAASEELSPEFAKTGLKTIHAILAKSGNEMKLDRLALRYGVTIGQDSDTAVDGPEGHRHLGHRHQIRILAAKKPDVFSISVGAEASIRRLQDETGKATGLQPFPGRGQGSVASTDLQRFSKKVRELGYRNADQWNRAKKSYGVEILSLEQAKDWIAKHGTPNTIGETEVVPFDDDASEVNEEG